MSTLGDSKRTFVKSLALRDGPGPSSWQSGERIGYQSCDLGLNFASNGEIGARLIRRSAQPEGTGEISHDLDLHFLYVSRGSIELSFTGTKALLGTGDTIALPGGHAYTELSVSRDFEGLEITAPADAPTLTGKRSTAAREQIFERIDGAPIITRERPNAYAVGQGPRQFFSYRDLGLSIPTAGRIHIQLVRPVMRPPGGTGYHYHTMGQFAVGIAGWADLYLGHEARKSQILPGTALSVPPGYIHDASDFSLDYLVLEACFPAIYDTISVPTPDGNAIGTRHV